MAYRRRPESDDMSLFPFLSVLASIIGVLTLLISAMALSQMDNETVARAEKYEKLRKKLDERKLEIETLKQQVNRDDAGEKQKELANQRERLEQLQNQLDRVRLQNGQQPETLDIPRDDLVAQQQDVAQVQQELEQLREQVAQLEAELANRNKPAQESAVSILPSGSGRGLQPMFVECAAGSVVIHSNDSPLRIRRDDLASDATFFKLISQSLSSNTKTIIFLVRDDGLATYRQARDLANRQKARNGKLPVVGQGRIDLSYFNKKK